MEGYQTEDQQLAKLKQLWNENGRFFTIVLLLTLLAIGGFRYYQHHKNVRQEQASLAYMLMLNGYQTDNNELFLAQYDKLKTEYPTVEPYALMAGLLKSKYDLKNENPQQAVDVLVHLTERFPKSPFTHIARTRLARIYYSLGDRENALSVLNHPTNGFTSLYEEVRGDILIEEQRYAEAEKAYQKALDHLPSDQFKPFLLLKLQNVQVGPEREDS